MRVLFWEFWDGTDALIAFHVFMRGVGLYDGMKLVSGNLVLWGNHLDGTNFHDGTYINCKPKKIMKTSVYSP